MDHPGDVVENQCSCPVTNARCKHVAALMKHILRETDAAVDADADNDADAADQAGPAAGRTAPAVPVADRHRSDFGLKPLPPTAKGKRKLPGYLGQNRDMAGPAAQRTAVAAATGSKPASRAKKAVVVTGKPKGKGKAPLKFSASSRSGPHAAAAASSRYKVTALDLIAYARDILSRKESDNPRDPVGVPPAVSAPVAAPGAGGSAAAAAAAGRDSSDSSDFDDAETQLQVETGNGSDGTEDEYGGETEVLADQYGGETEANPEIDGAFDAETQEMVPELGAVPEEGEAAEQPIPSRVAAPTPLASVKPLVKKKKRSLMDDLWA